jgi:Family of unknown function (DUF5755)
MALTSVAMLPIVFISLLLLVVGFFLRDVISYVDREKTEQKGDDMSSISQQPVIINVERGGDDRYSMAPRPQRRWTTEPDYSSLRSEMPSIPTRGFPDQYQQMGIMTTEEGGVLPLYGRRVAPRSDKFQYYTRTDTYNPVALPVSFKKRDCQDSVGCDELFDGDTVKMAGTGAPGKVKLYRFDGPVY